MDLAYKYRNSNKTGMIERYREQKKNDRAHQREMELLKQKGKTKKGVQSLKNKGSLATTGRRQEGKTERTGMQQKGKTKRTGMQEAGLNKRAGMQKETAENRLNFDINKADDQFWQSKRKFDWAKKKYGEETARKKKKAYMDRLHSLMAAKTGPDGYPIAGTGMTAAQARKLIKFQDRAYEESLNSSKGSQRIFKRDRQPRAQPKSGMEKAATADKITQQDEVTFTNAPSRTIRDWGKVDLEDENAVGSTVGELRKRFSQVPTR